MSKYDDDNDCDPDMFLLALAHAYILADKYQLPELQNEIVRIVVDHIGSYTLVEDLMMQLIRLTPTESILRRVMLEEVTYLVYSDGYKWKDFEELSVDVHGDMLEGS